MTECQCEGLLDHERPCAPCRDDEYQRGYRAGLEAAAYEIINICCAETQCQVGIEVARRIEVLVHNGNEETDADV